MGVELGSVNAMYFLAVLFDKEFNDIEKARKYYQMAVEAGDIDAMSSLAWLYERELKDFRLAQKYYQMAVEAGDINSRNSLADLLFQLKKEKNKALTLIKENTSIDLFTLVINKLILLWNNENEKAISGIVELIKEILEEKDELALIDILLLMLMAKKQYNFTLKLFENTDLNLKETQKPLYYALMYFMQDRFPDEYKRMGSELKETVEEVIAAVKQMAIDYK
jgi:hypothetical protein